MQYKKKVVIMNKKIVILGGGTGMGILLKGLKQFPFDITAIVSVCDDGQSTGRLREEFNILAVGDIRKIIVSLSETEPVVKKMFDYRFQTNSDLDGHSLGNLLLTGLYDICGSMSDAIESLSNILKLKGKVVPLTEDNVTLVGKMEDGLLVEGEHNITEDKRKIVDVFYKNKPTVSPEAINAIKESDAVILSMGSLFTSIIPNLLCPEIIETIDKSNKKIIYVCNMMTQPGETDNFKVSDHIQLLNKYLGKKKIDAVIVNNGKLSKNIVKKYATLEQKDPVIVDKKNIHTNIIEDNYVLIENNIIRHNTIKVALAIYTYLI